jgi:predicted double-glycine peptidase
MVLELLGVLKEEGDLRALCDSTYFGTDAVLLVQAARDLGFEGTRKYSMGFADLRRELERGVFPIVYIRTRLSANGPAQMHSVVVIKATEDDVHVNDPWRGEYVFPSDQFLREWAASHDLTIIVER